MPHIAILEGLPGIRGLFTVRSESAKPRFQLADVLLRGPGTLSPGTDSYRARAKVIAENGCAGIPADAASARAAAGLSGGR